MPRGNRHNLHQDLWQTIIIKVGIKMHVISGGRGGAGLQDGRARAVSEHCRGTVPAGGQSCSQKKEMEILQNKTQLSKF